MCFGVFPQIYTGNQGQIKNMLGPRAIANPQSQGPCLFYSRIKVFSCFFILLLLLLLLLLIWQLILFHLLLFDLYLIIIDYLFYADKHAKCNELQTGWQKTFAILPECVLQNKSFKYRVSPLNVFRTLADQKIKIIKTALKSMILMSKKNVVSRVI